MIHFLAGVGTIVCLVVAVAAAIYLATVEEQVERIRGGALDPDDWTVLPLARWWVTGRWDNETPRH